MKSPWTFVAQLVTRRRSGGDTADKPEHEGDGARSSAAAKALPMPEPERLIEHELRLPDDEATTQGTERTSTGTAGSESENAAPPASAIAEPRRPAQTQEPQSAPAVRPKPARPRKNDAAKGRLAASAPGQSAEEAAVASEQVVEHRRTGNPLMDLDEEIRQLRNQLSVKLRQQNAQLKTMLKRYEGR